MFNSAPCHSYKSPPKKKNSPQPGSLVFPVPTAGAARGGGLKGLLANFSMP